MVLSLLVAAVSGALVLRRIKKGVVWANQRLKKRQAILNQVGLHHVSKIKKVELQCISCKEYASNVVFKPCLHLIVCQECDKTRRQGDNCARCGTPIEESINIFNV